MQEVAETEQEAQHLQIVHERISAEGSEDQAHGDGDGKEENLYDAEKGEDVFSQLGQLDAGLAPEQALDGVPLVLHLHWLAAN